MTGTYKHCSVAATLDRDNTLRLQTGYLDFESKDGAKIESFERQKIASGVVRGSGCSVEDFVFFGLPLQLLRDLRGLFREHGEHLGQGKRLAMAGAGLPGDLGFDLLPTVNDAGGELWRQLGYNNQAAALVELVNRDDFIAALPSYFDFLLRRK